MIFVIMIYDIQTEANTHGNMLKLGRKYLHHIQKSCFHGYLSYKKVGKLEKELEKILTPEDHVIIYKMTANKYLDIQEFGLEKTKNQNIF